MIKSNKFNFVFPAILYMLLATSVISCTLQHNVSQHHITTGIVASPISTQAANATQQALQSYTQASYFSISYPPKWQVRSPIATEQVILSNPARSSEVVINTNFPGESLFHDPASYLKAQCANHAQCKQDNTTATNVLIGGQAWQKSTALFLEQNKIRMKQILLAYQDAQPGSKIFTITCTAPENIFEAVYNEAFAPILSSFQFKDTSLPSVLPY